VFTEVEREQLRTDLLARARADRRISGGAITGSGSIDALDRWSDIDLAFGLRDADQLTATLDDFTDFLRTRHGAIATIDVRREPWVYRVFLLSNTLQVDVAMAPATHFGALAPTFKLAFGEASDAPAAPLPDARELIGYGWLYGLHVRSSIARGRHWQALYMLNSMRDQVVALAELAAGLPAREARGIDRVPEVVRQSLEATIARSVSPEELRRAFGATTRALLNQVQGVDELLAQRLTPVMELLLDSAQPDGEPPHD
jgi:hypothetical protein